MRKSRIGPSATCRFCEASHLQRLDLSDPVLLDMRESGVLSASEIRRLHGWGSGTFRPVLNDRRFAPTTSARQRVSSNAWLAAGRAVAPKAVSDP
ncbi:hypothetical protein MES5069_620110 [Mesorhizobium escarrei]|uniref:Uncharacterized protein n=1 Tax=Mesorhizobium escarrei TaxID=666018 RepID=A0ABN8KC52_9HYPH|nr:hypothetical protein MES5069_620110 [Mesorhizobium escarrei]